MTLSERPGDIENRIQTANNAINYGTLLTETGRLADAEPLLLRSTEILDRLIRDDARSALGYRTTLWEPLAALGKVYRSTGREPEARESYRRSRDILLTLPHPDEQALYGLAATETQCTVLEAVHGSLLANGAWTELTHDLDLAMNSLRKSLSAGFTGLDRLNQDTDLDPLRSRADFQRLLGDLACPAYPIAP
jgi:hypothetical protein